MSDEHNSDHEHHAVNYTAIFALLCGCTLASIGFDWYKDDFSKPTLVMLILGVAMCKATFVLLYFMHIKFERAWKYVLLAPTAVLACALPFALAPDIAFHYYLVAAPQRDVKAAEHGGEHAAPGHAEPGHAAPAHGENKHDAAGHDHKADKPEAEHKGDAHPAKKAH